MLWPHRVMVAWWEHRELSDHLGGLLIQTRWNILGERDIQARPERLDRSAVNSKSARSFQVDPSSHSHSPTPRSLYFGHSSRLSTGLLLSILPRPSSPVVSREIFLNGSGYITPPDENLLKATPLRHGASQSFHQRAPKQPVTSLEVSASPEKVRNLFELF